MNAEIIQFRRPAKKLSHKRRRPRPAERARVQPEMDQPEADEVAIAQLRLRLRRLVREAAKLEATIAKLTMARRY